ncbi:flagellin [Exiguobacterium sp. Leaf187]|uniref:flagellin N-terminal helical domain-containing protein n=1 Tax=Exiguobacterium TaxID=33986 RepID=UPI0003C3AE04|nr:MULTISPECIES: flagellin [Exiguobacterium]AHA30631.1 flagellin [Exiguobacterium sp. MH3]KQS19869.1 flagellin [Exiguobacterium sp. Leaf187]MCQ4089332.1 flagellin [Exiguobacterium sp. LL15]
MKISNNVQALKAYRNLTANQLSIKTTMDKLSSGQKINRAADDAAGLALSEKMRNRLQALDKAEQNVLDGISMVQTLEGGMTETHSLLQRMRELAVQASNGTLAPEDRSSLQSEIDQLTNEVTRIAKTTQFNGKDILTGDFSEGKNAIFIQSNAGANEGISITVEDMRALSLGISTTVRPSPTSAQLSETSGSIEYSLSVMTRESADSAISLYTKAIDSVSNQRAKLGAIQNRFEATNSVLGISRENLTASESRIRDTDMAQEMMEYAKYNILNQSGMAMIAQANALPQGVLQLLN